nr:HAD family hydrolase [Auraticoccus cholistanensis]
MGRLRGAGIRKPDPRIFTAALAVGGHEAGEAWMVGDSADHDVRGARAVGARSVWLHRGRCWPADAPPPDHVAGSFAAAVEHVVAAGAR